MYFATLLGAVSQRLITGFHLNFLTFLSISRTYPKVEDTSIPEVQEQVPDMSQGKRGKFAQSRNTPAIRIEVEQ